MEKERPVSNSRFVVANWKCSKTLDQSRSWLQEFAGVYRAVEGVQVIVAPPAIWLVSLAEQLRDMRLSGVSLAIQDVSPFPRGSYTGAIAADMLKGYADYAIIGHAERRRYFHETSQDAANKVNEAADAGIGPIICVDTSYAMSQLAPLTDLDCERLLIAYCPIEDQSYREPQEPETVMEAARFLADLHPARPIIYGGAITPEVAGAYAAIQGISGLLVGAASLDPLAFAQICSAVAGCGN